MTRSKKIVISVLGSLLFVCGIISLEHYRSADVDTVEIVDHETVEYLHKTMWGTNVFVVEAECERFYLKSNESHREILIKFSTHWGTEYGSRIFIPKRVRDPLSYVKDNIKERKSLLRVEEWHDLWIQK